MSERVIKTKRMPLRTFGAIERALKWGWTVNCHLLALALPVGGIKLSVSDVQLCDPEFPECDYDFEVLTIQGWHRPTTVWAVKPASSKEFQLVPVAPNIERDEEG